MSTRVDPLTFVWGVAVGFLLGAATLTVLISNNASQISSPPLRNVEIETRRALLADPRTIAPKPTSTEEGPVRYVHVGNMCRCDSGLLGIPGPIIADGYDTEVIQQPSLATGNHAKHFVQHTSVGGCSCMKSIGRYRGETTTDMFLKKLEPNCPPLLSDSKYDWENMPDLGVEETLPIFVGVLSYQSPLSLNATLHNWLDHDFLRRIRARDTFVQFNHRSQMDDQILMDFREAMRQRDREPLLTPLGSTEQNLHPGLAISDMCRRAESHPEGHPNGENLLVFLEKDWNLYNEPNAEPRNLEHMFRGINALAQRGVPLIRLKPKRPEVSSDQTWPCPAQGYPFECTRAHQHRWSNQPIVISCKWFLRYLEPFALLNDPIMYGCREGFQEKGYCDWEEAMQDGRIAWTNSQWVMAFLHDGRHRMFFHREVDG